MRTVVNTRTQAEYDSVIEIMKQEGKAFGSSRNYFKDDGPELCINTDEYASSLAKCSTSYYREEGDEIISYSEWLSRRQPAKPIDSKQLWHDLSRTWIKLTGIKAGSKVKVVRKANREEEKVSTYAWMSSMNKNIGKIMSVRDVDTQIQLEDGWHYHYTCLEVIQEDEYKSLAEFMAKHKYVGFTSKVTGCKYTVRCCSKDNFIALSGVGSRYTSPYDQAESFQKEYAEGRYVTGFKSAKELMSWMEE